jgi:hypothetical protein
MLTPLTKIIKSKANSFHPFVSSFLDFILCNDEINMMWKRSKYKWWMKGERNANGGRMAENEL